MPVIGSFGEEVLKKLAQSCERMALGPKEHLVMQDKHSQYVWIVAEGQLKSTFINYFDQ